MQSQVRRRELQIVIKAVNNDSCLLNMKKILFPRFDNPQWFEENIVSSV